MRGVLSVAILCIAVATLARDTADGWDLLVMVPLILLAASSLLRDVAERVANRVLSTGGGRATSREEQPTHDDR